MRLRVCFQTKKIIQCFFFWSGDKKGVIKGPNKIVKKRTLLMQHLKEQNKGGRQVACQDNNRSQTPWKPLKLLFLWVYLVRLDWGSFEGGFWLMPGVSNYCTQVQYHQQLKKKKTPKHFSQGHTLVTFTGSRTVYLSPFLFGGETKDWWAVVLLFLFGKIKSDTWDAPPLVKKPTKPIKTPPSVASPVCRRGGFQFLSKKVTCGTKFYKKSSLTSTNFSSRQQMKRE
jgi:hypothetical protein